MIAADAEDAVESLLSKPSVEAVDVVRVTGEAVTTVAAMDEEVAAEPAEILVPAVGIADDDESHRKKAAPLQSGVDMRPASHSSGIRNLILETRSFLGIRRPNHSPVWRSTCKWGVAVDLGRVLRPFPAAAGAESNHRHADFQSQTEIRDVNYINRLAGAPVARNAQRCSTVQD